MAWQCLESFLLFGGQEVDLAGEAVFVGVETGALLAGLGCWSRGASGSFGKLGVVVGDDLGSCLLVVSHGLVRLFTAEHGDVGILGRECRRGGGTRLKGKGRLLFS
jgi:hypothetical protein